MLELIKKILIDLIDFAKANRLKGVTAIAAMLACAFFPPLAFMIPTIAAFLTFLGPVAIPAAFATIGVGMFMVTSIADYTGSALINALKICCSSSKPYEGPIQPGVPIFNTSDDLKPNLGTSCIAKLEYPYNLKDGHNPSLIDHREDNPALDQSWYHF
jgi:hypothetical protein